MLLDVLPISSIMSTAAGLPSSCDSGPAIISVRRTGWRPDALIAWIPRHLSLLVWSAGPLSRVQRGDVDGREVAGAFRRARPVPS